MYLPKSLTDAVALLYALLENMTFGPDTPIIAGMIVEQLHGDPARNKKLITDLSRAGILETKRGTGGGVTFRKPFDTITVLDVYQAVTAEPDYIANLASDSLDNENDRGEVSYLLNLLSNLETQFQSEISKIKISDLSQQELKIRQTPPQTVDVETGQIIPLGGEVNGPAKWSRK